MEILLLAALCILVPAALAAMLIVILSVNSARISREEELAEEIRRQDMRLKLHKWSVGHTDSD